MQKNGIFIRLARINHLLDYIMRVGVGTGRICLVVMDSAAAQRARSGAARVVKAGGASQLASAPGGDEERGPRCGEVTVPDQLLDHAERDAVRPRVAQERGEEPRVVLALRQAAAPAARALFEVDDDDARRRAEEDVLQFQVAVRNAAPAVQRGDLRQQLPRDRAVVRDGRPVRAPPVVLKQRRDDAGPDLGPERVDKPHGPPRRKPRVHVPLHGEPPVLLRVPRFVAADVRDELGDARAPAHADSPGVPPPRGDGLRAAVARREHARKLIRHPRQTRFLGQR